MGPFPRTYSSDRAQRVGVAAPLLVSCGLIIGLMLAVSGLLLTVNSRNQVIVDGERELKNLVHVLAEETDRGFQAGELVQNDVIGDMVNAGIDSPEKFVANYASIEVHNDLLHRIAGLPYVNGVALLSAHGQLVNVSHTWPVPTVNVTDRDFFQALTSDPTRTSFISAPTKNRTNGDWNVLLSRAYRGSDGRLIGVVNVAMELAAFERFFATISLSDDASVTLFRRDGMLLARFPHIELQIGKAIVPASSFDTISAAPEYGAAQRVRMVDGIEQRIALHSAAHYPLIVAVSNSTRATLVYWRTQTSWLPGALALIRTRARWHRPPWRSTTARPRAGKCRLTRRRWRQARRTQSPSRSWPSQGSGSESEHEARRQWLRFDSALNNMLQGLLMFDGAGQLQVVNRQFNRNSPGSAGADQASLISAIRRAGAAVRVWSMFQPCFLAVERTERMTAKSFAPSSDRKPPEIFWRNFIIRPSCSARLLAKGTAGSVRKRSTSCLRVFRRSKRLWPTRRGGRPRRLAFASAGCASWNTKPSGG